MSPPHTTTKPCLVKDSHAGGQAHAAERHAHFDNDDVPAATSHGNAEHEKSRSSDPEGEEGVPSSSDDDTEDEDDEETHERSQAFKRRHEASVRASRSASHSSLAHKLAAASVTPPPRSGAARRAASAPSCTGGAAGAASAAAEDRKLVHRWDEYGDFLSRSERSRRNREAEGDDNGDDTENARPGSAVQFGLVQETELPPLHPEDHSKCFMTPDSWERIDLDVELTKKRWSNHTAGLLPFDHGANTTRGLECVLCETRARRRDETLVRHATSVLQEQNRQRLSGEFYDAEQMRAVAAQTSLQDEAHQQGLHDEQEARDAWTKQPQSTGASFTAAGRNMSPKKGKPKLAKKHGSGGGLFGLLGFHSKPKKQSSA